jgi:stage V sporulation protein D (sporulation-specific penicillin-binding protein)
MKYYSKIDKIIKEHIRERRTGGDLLKSKKRNKNKIVISKARIIFIASSVTIMLLILIGRLGYTMIYKSDDLNKKAICQWETEVEIRPRRGKILDRNGQELAGSVEVFRVDADLEILRQRLESNKLTMRDITPELAKILDLDEEELYEKMTKRLNNGELVKSSILKRKITKDQVDAINALNEKFNLWGILIYPDTKRYYTNDNFLAHVLGHVNIEDKGVTGVELMYDKYLRGIPGIQIFERDARGVALPNKVIEYTKPIDGRNVILTIDEAIQHFAERAAEQGLKKYKPKSISVIVMNPNNGEVLAMVNKPDYNPNKPWDDNKSYEENQRMWRNIAISNNFEPGSTFKVVTTYAALAEKVTYEAEKFNCKGYKMIQGQPIYCWNRGGHGEETLVDLLKNSCNPGMMELAERLGAEKLNKYVQLFGFGKRTGIDLNGEASGIIMKTEDIKPVNLATISFGQTNAVTGIQFMKAFNAIANGGNLITPHVMKEITHYDEGVMVTDIEYDNYNTTQILDENIARNLRRYLQVVVDEGGGKLTKIPGYNIAGKTGTAQKPAENGGGYGDKHIHSFVGMAPSDNPQITISVVIDEPSPEFSYSSQTAPVIAKQIFEDTFEYLSVNPGAIGIKRDEVVLKDVKVPKLKGLDIKEAKKVLKENNLRFKIASEGKRVYEINPPAGSTVKEGQEITIYAKDLPKEK